MILSLSHKGRQCFCLFQYLYTEKLPIATKNKVPFLIKSGLLKSKENFKYSIIFEISTINYSVKDKIDFDYRIKNTVIINSNKERSYTHYLLAFISGVFISIGSNASIFKNSDYNSLFYIFLD